MLTIDEIRRRWGRSTNLLKLTDTPTKSLAGAVEVCNPGETWPTGDNGPLHPLLQVCVDELPRVPEALADVAYLTIFGQLEATPRRDQQSGNYAIWHPWDSYSEIRWVARGAPTERLSRPDLSQVPIGRGFVQWVERDDVPSFDDVCDAVELEAWPYDMDGARVEGTKVGGWPCLIQGPACQIDDIGRPQPFDFVMQFGSSDNLNLMIGDAGRVYVTRGMADRRDHWDLWEDVH